MLLRLILYSFYIILVTKVMSSQGHPDCNPDRVVEKFFYMCNAYTPYSSKKRETNAAEGNGQVPQSNAEHNFVPVSVGKNELQSNFQLPQKPENSQNPSKPNNNVQTKFPLVYPPKSYYRLKGSSSYPTPSNNAYAVQDHGSRRKEMSLPAAYPNEPEDFASFNDWYLNPVYADADWQSAIERWRRKSHINDEIWRFVKNKCCVKGCPFPDEYWELDKRVNICGMRK